MRWFHVEFDEVLNRYLVVDTETDSVINSSCATEEEAGREAARLGEAAEEEAARDEAEWRRECAMEAGMGLGVHAYNDAMGWATTEEDGW